MKLEIKAIIGKKRTLVIPKKIAERLKIKEGMVVKLKITEEGLLIEPIPNAIEWSLNGPKFAEVTLEEIEEISNAEQKRFSG